MAGLDFIAHTHTHTIHMQTEGKKDGNVLFNDALNTFYTYKQVMRTTNSSIVLESDSHFSKPTFKQ